VADDLYEAIQPKVSQGDILRVAPHCFLSQPLTRLRPLGSRQYEMEVEPFSDFNEKTGEIVAATAKRRLALVLTPDCEIDKQNRRWLVCPIQPLSDLSKDYQDILKRNRVLSALYLPGHLNHFPDGYADFNQITTLEPDLIRAAERLLSLSDLGRIALYKQYVRWFTRWTMQEIPCPKCGITFDPTLVLPVRNP
jgi:hypothetical protein